MTKQPKNAHLYNNCPEQPKRFINEQYHHQAHCNAPSHIRPFAKGVTCSCRKEPEQPNTELLIVKTIQGLTTCINNELEKLVVLTACMLEDERKVLIRQALEEIDLFEKTTLFELQKAVE